MNKCCYVHLHYFENDKEKNEYKCLQFSESEKLKYSDEFYKKNHFYPEIDCE